MTVFLSALLDGLQSHFGGTAATTWSKTMDNLVQRSSFTNSLNPRRSQDAGEFFQSGLDLSHDYSLSIADIPHRFVASAVYEVPFKSSNGFLNAVIGGWEVTGIFQVQSGQLVDIQSGIDSNRNGDSAGDRTIFNPSGDRNVGSGIVGLTLVNGVVTPVAVGLNASLLNVRAYVPGTLTNGVLTLKPNAGWVQAGYFAAGIANGGAGLAPRNAYRTKPYNNTDMDFIKNTRFGRDGRYNFQIGAEAHNSLQSAGEITVAGVGSGGAVVCRTLHHSVPELFIQLRGVWWKKYITMRAKFIF